jgi:UPF0716 protein FxsA
MALLLFILFIVLPIAEIYVIIQVGGVIGWAPTLLLLILDGFVGAALARSQGRVAWERFNLALTEGRVPARETLDGAMIIVGGAFLLAPGFITDLIGFALLIPPTRAVFRGVVARLARRRVAFAWTIPGGPLSGAGRRAPGPAQPRGYDYEGTAHEVREPIDELKPGDDA